MSKVMKLYMSHFLWYEIATSYAPATQTPVNIKTYPGRQVVLITGVNSQTVPMYLSTLDRDRDMVLSHREKYLQSNDF
jgi:hypothetical protein